MIKVYSVFNEIQFFSYFSITLFGTSYSSSSVLATKNKILSSDIAVGSSNSYSYDYFIC